MGIKWNDYLSIFIGSIIVDTIIIYMNYYDIIFVSKKLKEWYTKFRISAQLMDILIIVLYIIGGLYISEKYTNNSIVMQLLFIVLVQLIGDLIFYKFFDNLSRGYLIFDFFKDYAGEMDYERNDWVSKLIIKILGLKKEGPFPTGIHALWSDALMVIFSTILSIYINNYTYDTKIILLMISIYISQYILYLK